MECLLFVGDNQFSMLATFIEIAIREGEYVSFPGTKLHLTAPTPLVAAAIW